MLRDGAKKREDYYSAAHYNHSVITSSDRCVKIFFFHLGVYYWIIHLLSIPCPNRTDSSLHSIKSVSLISLLFCFLFFCSSCQKQWALLNNAWRMMNYGQEWHIKKNGPFTSLYGSLMWTGISHEIPFTWPSQHARILR